MTWIWPSEISPMMSDRLDAKFRHGIDKDMYESCEEFSGGLVTLDDEYGSFTVPVNQILMRYKPKETQMDEAAHHETQLEQQQELERIYRIIIAINSDCSRGVGMGDVRYEMIPLNQGDLAKIRSAFGLNQERTVV